MNEEKKQELLDLIANFADENGFDCDLIPDFVSGIRIDFDDLEIYYE